MYGFSDVRFVMQKIERALDNADFDTAERAYALLPDMKSNASNAIARYIDQVIYSYADILEGGK